MTWTSQIDIFVELSHWVVPLKISFLMLNMASIKICSFKIERFACIPYSSNFSKIAIEQKTIVEEMDILNKLPNDDRINYYNFT